MVWSDTHLLNQFQLLEIVFNYVTIAGIPKQEFQQVEGGDTDVGGVTVIFAVTHGGREGIRDTHVEFAVPTQRGHRQMCAGVPLCVSTRQSRIIWTHRT